MNIEKNQIDDLNAIISITVEKDDYLPNVTKSLNEHKKKATIKGFRKGMVPMGMVKKMHGNNVLFSEVDKLISKNISDYIRENEIQILGRPIMEAKEPMNFDINAPEDYKFSYEIGIAPNFELSYQNVKTPLPSYNIKIDDEFINEELESIQKRFGALQEVETVADDTDILRVKLIELNEDETVKENGVENESSIMVNQLQDEKLLEAVRAAKKGDQQTLNIESAFNADRVTILNALLGIEKDTDISNIGSLYNMQIDKIETRTKAELNQELFKQVYPNKEIAEKEELIVNLKQDLEQMAKQKTEEKLRTDIYNRIIENTDFALPEPFLKKFIKYNNEKPITEEEIEKGFDSFKDNIKWELIVNKISKDKNLKLEDEEFMEFVKQDTRTIYKQHQGTELDDEQIMPFVQNMMSNKEYTDKAYKKAMDEKLFSSIISELTIKEEEITFKEFNKLG